MPKYLVQATYTTEGLKALKKDQASGRKQAIVDAVEGLGGKVESVHFAFGDFDVLVIVRLPDLVTANALALGVAASGLVRTKTTILFTAEETDKSLAKEFKYGGK